MDEKRERLKSMMSPNSLFFVPEADTRASISWSIGEIIELRAQLEAAMEELRRTKQDRKELREELALLRQLVTLRSDAVRTIAEQLIKKAT